MTKTKQFIKGARLGLPIALGYIPVSFSFGMLAVAGGIPPWAAILISMTNLTSAGQFAGINIISAAGGLWEMGITTFVINLRYMLMSLSLSQKIGNMSLWKRLITAFGITDEIFAVASTTPVKITFPFMIGLIAVPYVGWASGTAMGAFINNMLPKNFADAMGITLYAMFIAIIIPAARKDKNVLIVLITAVAASCILYFALPFVSSGWAVIIAAVLASAIGAAFFPHREDEI
ncbi:MAG: AzlC family ABC transporter permease [Hominilimicola sp.]